MFASRRASTMSGSSIENIMAVKLDDNTKWIGFGTTGTSTQTPVTLQDTDNWTVSVWVGNYDGDSDDSFIGKIGTNELIKLSSSGDSDKITFIDDGDNEVGFEDNDFLDDGSWHHLVFSANGTNISYFRDGVKITTATPTANTNFKIQQVGLVYSINDNLTQHTKCDISEMAVWSRGLSDAECIGLYNGGEAVNLQSNFNKSLTAWYRMGDGQSLAKPIPSELVVGGDCESGTNWQTYGSAGNFGLSSTQAVSGSKSQKWTGTAVTGGMETHDDNDFNLIAGKYYFLTHYIYMTFVNASGGGFDYTAGLLIGPSIRGKTRTNVAAGGWDFNGLMVKAWDTTSSGKMVVHNSSNNSAIGSFYVDDLSAVQAKPLYDFSGNRNHAYIPGDLTFGKHGE